MSRPKDRSVRAYGPKSLSTRTEMSWCRSVSGPNCLGSDVSVTRRKHGQALSYLLSRRQAAAAYETGDDESNTYQVSVGVPSTSPPSSSVAVKRITNCHGMASRMKSAADGLAPSMTGHLAPDSCPLKLPLGISAHGTKRHKA